MSQGRTYDVTVRIPVEFDSATDMATWLERVVINGMEEKDWTGGCVVIFRDGDGQMVSFQDGHGIGEEGFILPHSLYQMDDCEDEPYAPSVLTPSSDTV